MSLIQWSDAMSVGVETLDIDHKTLVDMVNRLFDGIQSGQGKTALSGILDGLIRYTVDHFEREERYFAQTGYPDAVAHKAQHEELKQQALAIREKFNTSPDIVITLHTMGVLKDWLINHIQGSDKKYRDHLNANGVF